MMNQKELEECEIIILEADGKVSDTNGYGYLIQKRLKEENIQSAKIYLPENTERLSTLPLKPTIISGGMTEVTKDIKWINQSKDFIRETIEINQKSDQKRPLFGICFGAQLIAESYVSGSVKYLDDPEIGNTKVIIGKKHPLFQGFPQEFQGYTFHYNQIVAKKEFNILSTNKHMGHHFIQAFEVPNAFCYGVQFHPEFCYHEFNTLMRTYQELIIELGLDYNEIIAAIKEIETNAKILVNFAKMD